MKIQMEEDELRNALVTAVLNSRLAPRERLQKHLIVIEITSETPLLRSCMVCLRAR